MQVTLTLMVDPIMSAPNKYLGCLQKCLHTTFYNLNIVFFTVLFLKMNILIFNIIWYMENIGLCYLYSMITIVRKKKVNPRIMGERGGPASIFCISVRPN